MKRLKTMRRTTAMMLAAAMVCATAAFATSYESYYADVTAGSKAYQKYLAELDANDWKIPLYDQEGNVIGAFEISKSEEIVPQAKSPAIVKSALAA